MKILIADDDPITRRLLESSLAQWDYEVTATHDGQQAWQALQRLGTPPPLLVLDWLMPGIDGVELCRRIRQTPDLEPAYVILLTSRGHRQDVVEGLEAGADDYVTKPFNPEELRARIQVGVRVMKLQRTLANRVKELEDALQRVNQLQGLLPICCYCKKIRDDGNCWHQVESYIEQRSGTHFSHSICPECAEKMKGQVPTAAGF